MKRELKFRAWNIPNKHMYYDIQKGLLVEKDGKIVVGVSFDTICKDAGSEVMQYTGLKDKNGKDIYEGDIVKPFPEDDFAQIIFMNGAFKIATQRKNGGYLCWNYMKEEIEIVGNIYENQEFLNTLL